MKKIQKMISLLLVLVMPFMMITAVKAEASAEKTYQLVVQEKTEDEVATYSSKVLIEEDKKLYDNKITYNKNGIALNGINLSKMGIQSEDSENKMEVIYITVANDSKIDTLTLSEDDKYFLAGNSTLTFATGLGDAKKEAELFKKLFENSDNCFITENEDGTVSVRTKSSAPIKGTEEYPNAVMSSTGVIFASVKQILGGKPFELVAENVTARFDESKIVTGDQKLLGVYDISAFDANGMIQNVKDGNFQIKIPKTEAMKEYSNFQVVYLGADDYREDMETTSDDDYVIFTTSHLSDYAVMGLPGEAAAQTADSPKTFDGITASMILGVVSILGISGIAFYSKKKKANQM